MSCRYIVCVLIRMKCVVEARDDELQVYCCSADLLGLPNIAPEQLVTVWRERQTFLLYPQSSGSEAVCSTMPGKGTMGKQLLKNIILPQTITVGAFNYSFVF